MISLRDFRIDDRFSFVCASSSKGVQKKYLKDGWYYKVDVEGFEGVREWLVSQILECSSLPPGSYVPYEVCSINGKQGCRSYNFLDANESFVSMGRLYTMITGKKSLADYLATLADAKERLDYVLGLVSGLVDTEQFKEYLCRMLQLDMLIENTDRHEFNYGLVATDSGYRVAPIFDNGDCLKDGSPCTLCGSFFSQVTVFGFPVQPAFTINYKKLLNTLDLSEFNDLQFTKRLRKNLKEYEYLFGNTKQMNLF